ELAVADAVDAGCDLLLDDLADSLGETGVKGCLLERPAGFARFQELQQIGRSRQAPDMGGENPFGARLHPRGPCAQARFSGIAARVTDSQRLTGPGAHPVGSAQKAIAKANLPASAITNPPRSEEHTSELQS